MVCNYVYDREGVAHKYAVHYRNALPKNSLITWEQTKPFRMGQYLLMHAAIYRRQLLLDCDITLPQKTFYVDNLYVYQPLPAVRTLYYLDVDLYHYYIGRSDQSVNEAVMISRSDQQIRVNRMMMDVADFTKITPVRKRRYMRNHIEIVTTVSSILLVKSGTDEALKKKRQLWEDMKAVHPRMYHSLRWRPLGIALHLPGRLGRKLMLQGYRLSQKIVGFN